MQKDFVCMEGDEHECKRTLSVRKGMNMNAKWFDLLLYSLALRTLFACTPPYFLVCLYAVDFPFSFLI